MSFLPVLGALSAIGGQLLGGVLDKNADKRYNTGQIDLAKLTNQQNIEFWKMQNAYNTPQAQMDRFRQAGLNPNLIYGQGNPGNAQSITGMTRPDNRATGQGDRAAKSLGFLVDAMQIKQMQIEMENRQQDTAVKEAEEAKKRKETLGVELNNEMLFSLMSGKKALLQGQIDKTKAETDLKVWQAKKEKLDYTFQNGTFNERMKAAMYLARQAKATLQGQELLNALRQLEVDLNKMGIQKNDPLYMRVLGRILNNVDF